MNLPGWMFRLSHGGEEPVYGVPSVSYLPAGVYTAGGGETKWRTAEDVFSWWMEEQNVEGQMSLFDREEWLGGNLG